MGNFGPFCLFFVVFCRFATSQSRALYRVFCFLNLLSSDDFTSQKHYIVIFFWIFFVFFLGFQCYDSSLRRSVLLKIACRHVALYIMPFKIQTGSNKKKSGRTAKRLSPRES